MCKQHFITFVVVSILSMGCVKKRVNEYDSSLPQQTSENRQLAYELVDPGQAKVEVATATLTFEAFQANYQLPSFEMKFKGNDYVKILRCQESYREYFEYSLSQVVKEKLDSRKWVWIDSFGTSKQCKIASNRFNSEVFQDLGAKNGKIFYIINPCVSASISQSGNDECSYHLSITNTLDYQQSPSTHVLHQSMELADAESAYDALISRLLGLSRAIVNEKELCEQAINKERTQANADRFGWDLLSAAIAVGGAFGARALISNARLNKAADYVKNYRFLSKSEGFLRSVAGASNFNKNLFTAGFFAGALGLSTLIRGLKAKNSPAANHPACVKAEELSQEIVNIQEEKSLERAMDDIIRISEQISALDRTFNAYGRVSFDMPAEASP